MSALVTGWVAALPPETGLTPMERLALFYISDCSGGGDVEWEAVFSLEHLAAQLWVPLDVASAIVSGLERKGILLLTQKSMFGRPVYWFPDLMPGGRK